MIEKIIDWSANNRFFVILIYIVVVGVGIYSVINLPVDAILIFQRIKSIFTEWMGRSPEIIGESGHLSNRFRAQGLPDVKAVRALQCLGCLFVFVIFEDNVDPYFTDEGVGKNEYCPATIAHQV
ncbi:MAG: hypothetical protein IPJ75_17820 [Ignavibacteriales bacterium]|nr:hypothetical protein [Ignavibacteriales bacterium]